MTARSKWRDIALTDYGPDVVSTPEKENPDSVTLATIATLAPVSASIVPDYAPNVANVANVIGVENSKSEQADAADLTKPHTPDLNKPEIEERAAIIEEGAGVPREWAEGFALMLAMPCPAGFYADQWRDALDGAGRFMDQWAARAAALGWTAAEVFGVYPAAPMADHSRRGLIYYLKPGERIAAITEETATFENRRGIRQSRWRRHIAAGGVPVWNIENAEV
jgi:hypothetical protein